jgi:hypothetical protein
MKKCTNFINYLKLPFQIFYWKNTELFYLKTDILLLPVMITAFGQELEL